MKVQKCWVVGSLPGIGYRQIRPLVVKGCPHEAVPQVPVWLNPCCLQKLKGAAPADSLCQTVDSPYLNDTLGSPHCRAGQRFSYLSDRLLQAECNIGQAVDTHRNGCPDDHPHVTQWAGSRNSNVCTTIASSWKDRHSDG